MAMETEIALFNNPLDLPMDSSFPSFATPESLVDPRLQAAFSETLTDKPSPGTPSQFFLTTPSLWERSSFEDATVDIFADLPRTPNITSEPAEKLNLEPESPTIKEEVDAEIPVEAPQKPSARRRSSRATSSGSSSRNSSGAEKSSATSVDSAASKVKKPRATTRKAQTRKSQAKAKAVAEKIQTEEKTSGSSEPPAEDDLRRNKFLERNRVAASKCRQKKKEWMHTLEETKAELEKKHSALHTTLNGLLAEISVMKNHLMIHANCGDHNIDQWFEAEARKFVSTHTGQEPGRPSSAAIGHDDAQHPRNGSIAQQSPISLDIPTAPSPQVKQESFSYDYMPDDLFEDTKV